MTSEHIQYSKWARKGDRYLDELSCGEEQRRGQTEVSMFCACGSPCSRQPPGLEEYCRVLQSTVLSQNATGWEHCTERAYKEINCQVE
jgi:hypothetical protein